MSVYNCKWCGGQHNKKTGHLYCDHNPNGSENYRKLVERNKRTYEKFAKRKLLEKAHSPEASIKRKQSAKKNWEDGVYDDVDFNGRFTGKKHSLEHRLKMSRLMSEIWQRRQPAIFERTIKHHNVITPVVSSSFNSYDFEEDHRHKTLVGGEFFEEDFFDFYGGEE